MNEAQISGIFASQTPAVNTMTLPEFLNIALQLAPDNAQLLQLNQIVQLAVSGTALDSATLAQVFGIQEAQVQQLFDLTLAPPRPPKVRPNPNHKNNPKDMAHRLLLLLRLHYSESKKASAMAIGSALG